MGTIKATRGTRTQFATPVANSGSKERIYFDNFNSLPFGFVFDKSLQLIERPVANPPVECSSSMLLPDSIQIFHHNLVSIKAGNNVLADIVVYPSHEPLLSARDFPKQSLGTLSAFGLKFAPQISKLSLNLLDFVRVEKLAVGSDCKIVYSEVNAKNFVLRSIAQSIDFFGKREHKKTFLLPVDTKQTLINIPSEVLFVAFRNAEWNLDTTFDCGQTQNIVLERSGAREIVSHGASVYDWLGLGFLDHSAGLLDTSNSQLALQSNRTQMLIDERVQLDVIPNFVLPSDVNAELQSLFVNSESFNYFRSCWDFDFSCRNASHNVNVEQDIYKLIASPPTLESVGIRS